MKAIRNKILAALELNDLESVAVMAKEDRNVLSLLARLAYDKETLTGWRAIKAVGRAARVLLPIDYPFLHETVRKLLWSLSDESGGIGWSSPEMLGEIVCTDPHKFSDIIPLIAEVYDIEETHFRPGVLYALIRIGEIAPALVLGYKDLAVRAMADKEPLVRFYGLELGKVLFKQVPDEDREAISAVIRSLETDTREVWVYKDTDFVNVHLKEEAQAAWHGILGRQVGN